MISSITLAPRWGMKGSSQEGVEAAVEPAALGSRRVEDTVRLRRLVGMFFGAECDLSRAAAAFHSVIGCKSAPSPEKPEACYTLIHVRPALPRSSSLEVGSLLVVKAELLHSSLFSARLAKGRQVAAATERILV